MISEFIIGKIVLVYEAVVVLVLDLSFELLVISTLTMVFV